MPPPQPNLDPAGYYARLGVTHDATRQAIVSAYRARARVLHPDVPGTGDAAAFVAMKQAYDVLSDRRKREDYDHAARHAAMDAIEPEVFVQPVYSAPIPSGRPPRLSDMPAAVWLSLGAVLCFGVIEVVLHLRNPPPVVRTEIRPNAPTVAPLPPEAHQEVRYGPTPAHLPGTPNFYVTPGAAAVLWRLDKEHSTLVPLGELPAFSSVQGLRLYQRNGLVEVVTGQDATGFIQAARLAPGNAQASRRAYCSYNAGPSPVNGEVLERRMRGTERFHIDNTAVSPAVVKLRDVTGAVGVSVFLAPGGSTDVEGIPAGEYKPDIALGELWSRACGTFAAGMRAKRWTAAIRLPTSGTFVVTEDSEVPDAVDIPDQVFEAQ